MVLIINFIYAGLFLTKLKRTSLKCIKKKGAKKHTQTLKQGKKNIRICTNLFKQCHRKSTLFLTSDSAGKQTASACMAYKHAHQFHAEPTQLRMCEG